MQVQSISSWKVCCVCLSGKPVLYFYTETFITFVGIALIQLKLWKPLNHLNVISCVVAHE